MRVSILHGWYLLCRAVVLRQTGVTFEVCGESGLVRNILTLMRTDQQELYQITLINSLLRCEVNFVQTGEHFK